MCIRPYMIHPYSPIKTLQSHVLNRILLLYCFPNNFILLMIKNILCRNIKFIVFIIIILRRPTHNEHLEVRNVFFVSNQIIYARS